MAEEKEEAVVLKWNPLGFVDGILEDWFALPSVRDVVPPPGEVARALFGRENTLDTIGEETAQRLMSKAPLRR